MRRDNRSGLRVESITVTLQRLFLRSSPRQFRLEEAVAVTNLRPRHDHFILGRLERRPADADARLADDGGGSRQDLEEVRYLRG